MSPGRLVLRVQVVAVIVGLVSCLSLDDVRAAENGKADVVLRHGKIYTADPARSFQQSIAFTGNSIVAVGDDRRRGAADRNRNESHRPWRETGPSRTDRHTHHPIDGAINGTKCSLANVGGSRPRSKRSRPAIEKCLDKEPGGANDWLEAVQLYNYGFEATAHDLDSIEKKRPIALDGNDGHTMWVNSRGLKLLGVTDIKRTMPAMSPARVLA